MVEDLHALGEALFRDEPPLGIDAGRAVREATAARRRRRRLVGAGLVAVAGSTPVAVAALHPPAGEDWLSPPVSTPVSPVPTRLDVPAGPSAGTARRYEALLRRQVELSGRSVSSVWWYTADGLPADERTGTYVAGVPARISLSLDGGGWVALAAGARSPASRKEWICGRHPVCRVSTVAPGVQRIEADATTTPRDAGGGPDLESSVTLLWSDGRYVSALAGSAHLLDPQPTGPTAAASSWTARTPRRAVPTRPTPYPPRSRCRSCARSPRRRRAAADGARGEMTSTVERT